MSFYYNSARQPEILRTIQKDETYSDTVGQNLSDILRFSSNKFWIKYSDLCKIVGELTYHGFATYNNVQTLGEEYTGIIRIDERYIALPTKLTQFVSILLEFGGEGLLIKLLKKLEKDTERNDELLPDAKDGILKLCRFLRHSIPYVKALHRSLFYIFGGRYHISKQFTGINYVLVRHWLSADYSVKGYKALGYITLLQLLLVLGVNIKKSIKAARIDQQPRNNRSLERNTSSSSYAENQLNRKKCVLCLEPRENTSSTQCGHLFCWNCIMDWLDQKEQCPVCREPLSKSSVVFLKNLL